MLDKIEATPLGRWAARGAAVFFVGFAGFQVALALGAPLGQFAWGGAAPSIALRVASGVAAIVLLAAAAVMLVRSGDWGPSLPRRPFYALNCLFAGFLALNTAANFASGSRAERLTMGVSTSVGAMLCILAAAGVRRVQVSDQRR